MVTTDKEVKMHKAIEDFLKSIESKEQTYNTELLETIRNDKNILGEALDNKQFISVIFSNNEQLYTYVFREFAFETISAYPEKINRLLSNKQYINAFLWMDTNTTKKLPATTVKDIIERITAIAETAEDKMVSSPSDKDEETQIDISKDSFLSKLNKDTVAKILHGLSFVCKLSIDESFLKEMSTLSVSSFTEIINNSEICFNWRSDPTKFFNKLGEEYQNAILQGILNKRIQNEESVLASEKISKDYYEKNWEVLLEQIDVYGLQLLFTKIETKFQNGRSKFVLEASKKSYKISKYLYGEDIEEYVNGLKLTSRVLWGHLLENKSISQYPTVFKKAFKAYCYTRQSLSSEFKDNKINISDAMIKLLTERELKTLAEKEIKDDGSFKYLSFNPELVAQRLSGVALADPQYYAEKILGKISAAIRKYKTGASIYEKICKFLSFPAEIYQKDDATLKKAFASAISLPTKEMQIRGCLFIADLLNDETPSALELKYRDLGEEIEKLTKRPKGEDKILCQS